MKPMVLSLAVLCTILGFAGVGAAKYPGKPIKLMVPYPPGGASDFQARIVTMLAQEEKYLGQPIVIINKPGAGGMVGWNWFVESAPKDGYDLNAYNVPHFIAQSIVYPKKAKYKIGTKEPIANWGADPAVLIVPRDSPFNSVKDLVEYAKKNPGKVTVSGGGNFIGHHIALIQFNRAAGIQTTHVPYAGGVPALVAVVSGEVMAGFNNSSDAFRSKERLKILAVADLGRCPFLPDVPTLKEAGYDVDDTSNNFRGIAAPAGTPAEVIAKLADVFPKMFNDKIVADKMKETGCVLDVIPRAKLKEKWVKTEALLKDMFKDLIQE
ncbi:MAG: tripartite tricarboxylate transporter substrate binding protein [Thermodesulfobacteriota bacterium]|nr:tripartite tricarboxylate transporter substrate binding protein [Thermodesulfobacteriota bacterium]